MNQQIPLLLQRIRVQKPLILNLTNFVTMDFIANGLLSLGASPIMSLAKEEMEDLIKLASCVVINIGTLTSDFMELAHFASSLANKKNKPIILDPVGAGATAYRTQNAQKLLQEHKIAIIRGNASEIAALINKSSSTKGVDSTIDSTEIAEEARELAALYNNTVCVSGKIDIIANKNKTQQHQFGSSLMSQVTGMGCLLTAVVAAFHAVEPDSFIATYTATLYYALSGEQAAQKAAAPGEFKLHFIDALFNKELPCLKETAPLF